ncbi:Tetraspanin/Peripherin [Trinorchestia longiramus]|nr:Tetraspanin/Peripherin [Trinorchestia longiramus]
MRRGPRLRSFPNRASKLQSASQNTGPPLTERSHRRANGGLWAAVMFFRRAMRYYRLWIYTCNAVLLAAVLVLVAVALHTVTHSYFPLVPGPPSYDPTYLYAYVALFLQAGVVQALGCLGALRLSQKLLNIYWFFLVVLLIGDLMVGLVWFLRFPKLSVRLSGSMNSTLYQYGYDQSSTEAWDSLQTAEQCCGIKSPEDYSHTKWGRRMGTVPSSCCVWKGATGVQSDQAARHIPHNQYVVARSNRPSRYKNLTCQRNDHRPYEKGCERPLKDWMHSSAEFLMILGFCVITFIKFCFVGILRFEIQEMIEKIKFLQGDPANAPDPELAAALGLVLPGPQGETDILGNGGGGGGGGGGERGGGGGGGDCGGDGGDPKLTEIDSQMKDKICSMDQQPLELTGNGNSSIGIKDEPQHKTSFLDTSMSPLPCARSNVLQAVDTGGDSDTNSHTALITDTPVRRQKQSTVPDKSKHNGNNNEIATPASDTPLQHLFQVRQTQI